MGRPSCEDSAVLFWMSFLETILESTPPDLPMIFLANNSLH